MNEIIVYEDKQKNKNISYLEDGKIVENYNENFNQERIEGNIYAGKIQRVLPGMQAAFVDIGKSKNAFLHIKDIIPKKSNETGNKNENFENINIRDYVKVGMKVLVQVQKDKCQSKGAKVTTHIKLSGRFCVLIPNVDFVTVSSKIENMGEINRLKEIVKNNKPKGIGIIIRTSAISKNEKEILEDMESLISRWEEILNKYNKLKEKDIPVMLYKNYGVLEKLLLDVMDKNIEKITVSNTDIQKNTLDILNKNNNSINIEIKENLADYIKNQIDKINERKIWLKCGGFITIENTEALTAIDVNSGKYIGENQKENTIFNVNKEATIEIARQIRLRDIGGIIIIDYIDMNEENRNKLLEIWNDCLKNDRSKVQVVGFTPLNLLEITRKHMWS